MNRTSWSQVLLVAPTAGSAARVTRSAGADGGAGADAGPPPIELRVWRARRLVDRIVGLIGKPLPPPGAGLWLKPCMAVHTCGVRGALDLLFIDRRGVIVRIFGPVRPLRVRGHWRAWAVLEMRAGEARRLGIRQGMHLHWLEDGDSGHVGGDAHAGGGAHARADRR